MSNTKDIFTLGSTKKQPKECITAHKICVSILIRQFCLFRENGIFNWGSIKLLVNFGFFIARFRIVPALMTPIHRRDFCILILKLIQSPDLSLNELRELLLSGKYDIETRFMQKFDCAIKDLYTVGVGYLLDLAEYISRLTIDLQLNGIWCQINKNSVLGCYLRRLMLFFDKLTFSQITTVYESFKAYYKPCEADIKSRISFLNQSDIDVDKSASSASLLQISWYHKSDQWSRRQAELFIATQAALLQNNEESAHTPIELNKQIRNLLKSNPDLAEAHFLSYLNYLRVKEFCGAIDSLYHSFDRSTPIVDVKNNTPNNVDEKLKGFRYAALNLAVLHVQFGHKEEALAALKESIMMAQEANDNVCLQHALTWMYKLTNTNKELLIEHSVIKSMDLNLMYIASLGIQSYAQYAGLSGGNPKQIFETMTKSDVLNCQHTYLDLMSNSYSQKSSLWLLYGKTEMSSLWSQLLLHLNTDTLNLSKGFNGEGACQAICNIANHLLTEGEYQLSNTCLKLARQKFPNEPIAQNWAISEHIFNFLRSYHHGDWFAAENSALQIASIDKWESCLRFAELHIARGDFQSGVACINTVIDLCQNDAQSKQSISLKIRAMILLAELKCASATFNLPTSILTVLNSALSFANLYHLDFLCTLIHMHLANVQLVMGMPKQALKILDDHLVQMMAHGGCYDRARAMLLYVKCLVADSRNFADKKERILEATELLKKAKEDFHKVEARSRVKDVLYLQAQLYNEIDYIEERNDCALEYKQYQNDFQTKNFRTLLTSL